MKRLIDIVVSLGALLLLWPVLLLVMLTVRLKLGGPIFFKQLRPGLRGKPFMLFKFRTMLDTSDAEGKLHHDHERLTAFGRFLRSTSLDELPELWNVARGDMSLVGPRPLLMGYLPRYGAEQMRRHEVRPGITGLAQVKGRNALGWDEKFKLDAWYVDNNGLWLDFKILYVTVRQVFARDGISSGGHATMPEFTGSSRSDEDNK